MKPATPYDYLIAGAGAAGLSLAFALQKSSLSEKKILLIDREPKIANDRTWCFWSRTPLPYQASQQISWEELAVSHGGDRLASSISPYRYHHIRSADFYQEMRDFLATCPNVSIRYEPITNWGSNESGAWLQSETQTYRGRWLFNSIPPVRPLLPKGEIWLSQHFRGLHIQTEQACFFPGSVELMDFEVEQVAGSCFMYVLPFSEREALVEFTAFSVQPFSPETYHQAIESYLQDRYQVERWRLIEEEVGRIPMTTRRFTRKEGPAMLNIGSRGGLTKPTTGYTFIPIQRDCAHIVASLEAEGTPFCIPEKASRFRFYDRLLLQIMQDEPAQVGRIMHRLFRKNAFSRILTFLDEDTTFWQELPLLLRLPWGPFLRAICKSYLYEPFFSHPQLSAGQPQSAAAPAFSAVSDLATRAGVEPLHRADVVDGYSARSR